MGLKDMIRDKAVEIAQAKADEHLDLYEAGVQADSKLDGSAVGEKNSEKIQRGTVTQKFLDFLRGLWAEDKTAFANRLREEADRVDNMKEGE